MAKKAYYATGFYKGPLLEERFQRVARLFASQPKGGRLLDIGCGDGSFSCVLKEAMGAEEVFGLDISPEAVKLAQEQGIRAIELDVDAPGPYPFPSDYFDAIYCGEIIEHLFDPGHLLEEVYRLLKPEGVCVLTTPNLAGWPNRLALLLGFQPYPTAVSPRHEHLGKLLLKDSEGQWGHIRVFTLRALLELIKLHRFAVERLEGCAVTVSSPMPFPLQRPILFIDRVMSRFPSLATRVIVLLRKRR